MLLVDDIVANPNEPGIITYVSQFYFVFVKKKNETGVPPPKEAPPKPNVGSESTDKPSVLPRKPSKPKTNLDPEQQKMEKLRNLMLRGIEELVIYVLHKELQFSKIITVELLVKESVGVKPVIAIGKVGNKIAVIC